MPAPARNAGPRQAIARSTHEEASGSDFAGHRWPGSPGARALIRRIVDSVAKGRKYHLRVVFSDGTTHHSTRLGDPDALPTEFFHLLLGDTFGYSEGFWKDGTRTRDEAQHNNFDLICRKLRLVPGHRLVEVGPGWGHMAMLAADKYGASVTAYGLVRSQNDAMRMRMRARSLDDKVVLVERDHRELVDEPSSYDRFVSIGVHEHAGRDCNEQWIRSMAVGLRPGGIGLISATFNVKKRPTNYCTIKHIFPGATFRAWPKR